MTQNKQTLKNLNLPYDGVVLIFITFFFFLNLIYIFSLCMLLVYLCKLPISKPSMHALFASLLSSFPSIHNLCIHALCCAVELHLQLCPILKFVVLKLIFVGLMCTSYPELPMMFYFQISQFMQLSLIFEDHFIMDVRNSLMLQVID